jgi:hypothetical protein
MTWPDGLIRSRMRLPEAVRVARDDVVGYLHKYTRVHGLRPELGVTATRIDRSDGGGLAGAHRHRACGPRAASWWPPATATTPRRPDCRAWTPSPGTCGTPLTTGSCPGTPAGTSSGPETRPRRSPPSGRSRAFKSIPAAQPQPHQPVPGTGTIQILDTDIVAGRVAVLTSAPSQARSGVEHSGIADLHASYSMKLLLG